MKHFYLFLVVFMAGLGLGISLHRYTLVTVPASVGFGIVIPLATLTGRTWEMAPVPMNGTIWSDVVPEHKRQTNDENKLDLEIEIAVWCVIVTFFGLTVFLINKMVWKFFGKPLEQAQSAKRDKSSNSVVPSGEK